ncbi:hypothetical protein KXD40_001320 [Peronospora effusa]|uniref:Cyclin C-terminal domain-containing protein n=1 Tax=Peronospora effusa TaxID=542832 RepID=A0A3M6VQL8_9STRA|nr:hypothetical protein DD238_000336 [Peronospora effusa]UIZ21631.1 hypothetical protein KXD40_001320 [Peronospora effusa]
MGMNFWHSTHYLYWMKDVTKADLRKRNPLDRKHLTDDEIDSIHLANISCEDCVWPIGESAVPDNSRVCSPSLHHEYGELAAAVLLGFIALMNVLFWAGSLHFVAGVDEDESMYTFQDKDILECEFYVIEALQFDLILHHPFPSLLQLLDEFEIHEECLQLAWQLVQYSYRTDIILLYPPFMVAYAATYISCRDAGYDAEQVFATVNLKKELLLKIVGEFQEAVEEEKKLYMVQAAAIERLEEIIPDATAAETEAIPSVSAEK